MPELPEVETVVGDLNKADVVGKKILDVTVNWPKSISSHSPKEFKDYLIG
ncbi:MAG: DNA-formamidopyrimidine glycosylase, partial [Bacteroidia bacterium]|nr:DNA-formamidopyrimidine glycosylase [Bacteroidia bacterium]